MLPSQAPKTLWKAVQKNSILKLRFIQRMLLWENSPILIIVVCLMSEWFSFLSMDTKDHIADLNFS